MAECVSKTGSNGPVAGTIEKQCKGDKTWQRKDTKSNRNALNADVALYAI